MQQKTSKVGIRAIFIVMKKSFWSKQKLSKHIFVYVPFLTFGMYYI